MTEEFTFFPNERLQRLIEVFHQTFQKTYQTRLIGGAAEPLYRPAAPAELDAGASHAIIFTKDYFASALHEIAHWCIAGPQRRQIIDYGYWYCPDGRSEAKQREFELVEVKPQAMERIFAYASGQKFRISADNLDMGIGASETFIQAVHQQTLRYCEEGLPERPQAFTEALAEAFGCPEPMLVQNYTPDDLR